MQYSVICDLTGQAFKLFLLSEILFSRRDLITDIPLIYYIAPSVKHFECSIDFLTWL